MAASSIRTLPNQMIAVSSLILVLLTFSCTHVQARRDNTDPAEPDFSTFAVSTEMELGKALPIIEKAPVGVYVSVGAERSFRGFSMSRATKLYVVDISPKVLRFATINRELLRARDLKSYRALRFDSDYGAWLTLQKGASVEHSLTDDDFAWWQKNVRDLYAKEQYTLPEMLNRYETDINQRDYLTFYHGFKALFLNPQAKEHREIVKLILHEPMDKIEKRIKRAGISLSFSLDDLKAWRDRSKPGCFNEYLKRPGASMDVASIINFQYQNYLFDEALYLRLHRAALEKHIHLQQLNLSEEDKLKAFIDHIKTQGETLSVLDLNNTYLKDYIGDPNYSKIIFQFAEVSSDDSILLGMSNIRNLMCTQYQSYFGFRFSLLKTLPKDYPLGKYLLSLPGEIVHVMNQKLYDLEHAPPYFATWQELPPRL